MMLIGMVAASLQGTALAQDDATATDSRAVKIATDQYAVDVFM